MEDWSRQLLRSARSRSPTPKSFLPASHGPAPFFPREPLCRRRPGGAPPGLPFRVAEDVAIPSCSNLDPLYYAPPPLRTARKMPKFRPECVRPEFGSGFRRLLSGWQRQAESSELVDGLCAYTEPSTNCVCRCHPKSKEDDSGRLSLPRPLLAADDRRRISAAHDRNVGDCVWRPPAQKGRCALLHRLRVLQTNASFASSWRPQCDKLPLHDRFGRAAPPVSTIPAIP